MTQPPPPRGKRRWRLWSIFISVILITALLFYLFATPYLYPSIAPSFINVDADGDQLSNNEELRIGTDPLNADTDRDGLKDGAEVNTYHTNPLVSDTEGDGLNDGLEVNGWEITIDGIQERVASNPLANDSDGDQLEDFVEYQTYLTDPSSNDTDKDGLPDKWEVDFGFLPANSQDAFLDPDLDGLTNVQEYELGIITKNGALVSQKNLFLEIDYMEGYMPSQQALNYFATYYGELGIDVQIVVDDQISSSQLTAIGVSPDSLSSYECSLIETQFHDNPKTHVYAFYAKALSEPGVIGWASSFGAFISKETVNSLEGLSVLWLTDRVRAEMSVLLHEVGHTLHVIIRNAGGGEQYCSNMGCIMSAPDTWYDIIGTISQLVVLHSDHPRYCSTHQALIGLRSKWSVDENWTS